MTLTKFALPAALLMTLTACMDGGSAVSRSKTGMVTCPELGASAQYMIGSDVRCGPQAELPYTLQ